jgi:hypothetical protein
LELVVIEHPAQFLVFGYSQNIGGYGLYVAADDLLLHVYPTGLFEVQCLQLVLGFLGILKSGNATQQNRQGYKQTKE